MDDSDRIARTAQRAQPIMMLVMVIVTARSAQRAQLIVMVVVDDSDPDGWL